jgi:DNA repair exonuclease SbcCD ATPase subunit
MIRVREHLVLQVDPLFVLLTIQCLLISAGFSIFMIIKYRNLLAIKDAAQKELQILHTEVNRQSLVNNELMEWKDMFNELQEKFEGIRTLNEKLKDSIALLIPEAERSKEYEQLITDIEQSNKTLDNCIGSLKKENEELEKTTAALEREAYGLADLLQKSVRKEALDRAVEKKRSIELKYKKIVAEFDQLRTEHEKLQKSNTSLQKEYNALYDNIEEDKKGLTAENSA